MSSSSSSSPQPAPNAAAAAAASGCSTTGRRSDIGDDGNKTDEDEGGSKPLITNFRLCVGFDGDGGTTTTKRLRLYRCGHTDDLADSPRLLSTSLTTTGGVGDDDTVVGDEDDRDRRAVPVAGASSSSKIDADAERIVLEEATLVLDLRSSSERDEERARKWMMSAAAPPNGPFLVREPEEKEGDDVDGSRRLENRSRNTMRRRFVLRLDPLSPSSFMDYVDRNWLSSAPRDRVRLNWYKLADSDRLHELRMRALNGRGLPGLYQAILQTETGQRELRRALRAITVHLEEGGGGGGE